jgi:Outer membrane protein beta-barrel domain
MKKSLALGCSVLAVSMGSVALMAMAVPASAQSSEKKNYIGPQVNFFNGATGFGATSRFGVADNISVRPFVSFASAGSANVTFYGAAATYDFNLDTPGQSSGFAPYAGIGYVGATATAGGFSGSASSVYFELGSDYNVSDNIALNANYRFKDGGFFSIGGGLKF